jgi:hypothetical protein
MSVLIRRERVAGLAYERTAVAPQGWEFWRISRREDAGLEWLGATRPGARVAADRETVWTLVSQRFAFITNWYVTEDRARPPDESTWVHEWVEAAEARSIAMEVPEPSADQLQRLTTPDALRVLGRVDRSHIEALLGTRVAAKLAARRTR